MQKLVLTSLSLIGIIAVIAFLNFSDRSLPGFVPEVVGTFSADPLSEVSGMVKSRSYPNTYWVVNDSRNGARLFAVNNEGNNIIPTFSRFSYYGEEAEEGKEQWEGFRVLYAENNDWETMTVDENYLYVGDVGNNFNNRNDLKVYLLSEIDPTASTQSAVIKTLPVRYPEQTKFPAPASPHFDCEAMFIADGKLYFITKDRGGRGAFEPGGNLYRLDTDFTDQDNVLTLVDSQPDLLDATGAELSPDGQTLAVVSYETLWLFKRPAEGDQWLSGNARRYALDTRTVEQVETVIWDDDQTLLLTNEQRSLMRIILADLGE
ncbi:MAG: hypothetical protein P8M72_12910 [Gammaproteobacteria bacterium]|nr:hypothetical protein [Gammaproteobacteria bacterium]